jgi:DNA polymerase-3 subunit delta
MKIDARSADRFCKAPEPDVAGILLYGENQGLVEERVNLLQSSLLGGDPDPIQIVDITAAKLKDTPSLLADEVQARSLLGGRRVIRLRDKNAEILKDLPNIFTNAVGDDAVIILTSNSLPPRDKARKLFEDHDRAAAIPCYADDTASMERFVGDLLREHDVQVDPSVRGYLANQLGSDRQVAKRELEKLVLFALDLGRPLTIEDAAQVIDEGESLQLNDICFAVFDGDQMRLEQSIDRMYQALTHPVAILTAVIRHAHRLHLVTSVMAKGSTADQASKALRPPLFFKDKAAFLGQCQRWNGNRLNQALGVLCQAEIDCKSTGAPAETICRRALMRIAAAARTRR